MNKVSLYPYQKRAVNFILKKSRCGLFLDMGMGKTLISLTAIKKLIDDVRAINVLIIAPKKVCNSTWPNEIKKWYNFRNLTFAVCTGDKNQRIDALNKNVDIHIINRENIPWLIKNYAWKWDTVFIDESSSFKSHNSMRFLAMKAVLKYTENFVILTGTPNPQSYLDLWPQIYMLDQGERLGKNITRYREEYFTPNPYVKNTWLFVKDKEGQLKKKIKSICMSMLSKDYLELPELIYLDECIEFDADTRKRYMTMKKEFIVELQSGQEIEAVHGGAMVNKLLQFCNGIIYDEDRKMHHLHDIKLNALKEMIEERPYENFLIAYNYQSDLKALKELFKKEAKVLDASGKVQDQWNEGKIRILLAHPASAGHGLNLQFGGSNIVWYGLNWSLELYQQFNKRLHRMGQKKPVKIIHLMIKDTIEQQVLEALAGKAKTQTDLLNYLKLKLER